MLCRSQKTFNTASPRRARRLLKVGREAAGRVGWKHFISKACIGTHSLAIERIQGIRYEFGRLTWWRRTGFLNVYVKLFGLSSSPSVKTIVLPSSTRKERGILSPGTGPVMVMLAMVRATGKEFVVLSEAWFAEMKSQEKRRSERREIYHGNIQVRF